MGSGEEEEGLEGDLWLVRKMNKIFLKKLENVISMIYPLWQATFFCLFVF